MPVPEQTLPTTPSPLREKNKKGKNQNLDPDAAHVDGSALPGKEQPAHSGAPPHSCVVSLSLPLGFLLGHCTVLPGGLPDMEKAGPYRDVTDGESRDGLSVGRQAGHVGEVVQVPQDAGTVLGATHQEAEGD